MMKFESKSIEVFKYQYNNNLVYKSFCDSINIKTENIDSIEKIPFLPISLFKSNKIISGDSKIDKIFISSGTTGSKSTHYVIDKSLYEKNIINCFNQFYKKASDYAFIGVCPSPKSKPNSSLVFMINHLINSSDYRESQFITNGIELINLIEDLKQKNINYIIYGLSYALLDISEKMKFDFENSIVIETGGMKGFRDEIPKEELHNLLSERFGTVNIHSEYGMTELLSQSYAIENLKFRTPDSKRIMVRSETDPFKIQKKGRGAFNIIDLANINSCSFLATDDYGSVTEDFFKIYGRIDESDIRGCNQMLI